MTTPFFQCIISGLLITSLFACGNNSNGEKEINPEYMRDISEFKMDTSALHDNESIEILCASDQLFPTDEVDYYVHVVAVSQETGDTVNIFTTAVMSASDDDRLTEFHSAESDVAKILQNMNNVKEGVNVKDLKSNKFTKVYSDPEFIALKTSHFPSIIGMVGGEWSTSDLK